MKNKSKEYIIAVVLSCISLVLFGISAVTGLILDINYSIDKVCMYLGFSFLFLAFIFFDKSKKNNDK